VPKIKIYNVNSESEQLKLFVNLAVKYQDDWNELINYFSDFEEIFKFTIAKYTREEGEQILRPKYYYQVGGDCDDQFIFLTSLLLWFGIRPENIYLALASWNNGETFEHVYAMFKQNRAIYSLDALPENELGKVAHLKRIVRYWPITEFV